MIHHQPELALINFMLMVMIVNLVRSYSLISDHIIRIEHGTRKRQKSSIDLSYMWTDHRVTVDS